MPTRIEWADETLNPITGCTPISEGCQNCYARRMAKRLAGRFGYPKDDPFRPGTFHRNAFDKLITWAKTRNIFICSMGDIFHPMTSFNTTAYVMSVINGMPEHNFLILTKRPKWMKLFFNEYKTIPPNLWLGVTVEMQKYTNRLDELFKIPTKKYFVSVEPMLEPIDLSGYLDRLKWVICGAEQGPHRRGMEERWAFCLQRKCEEANIPFFFKKNSKGKPSFYNYSRREFPKELQGGRPC